MKPGRRKASRRQSRSIRTVEDPAKIGPLLRQAGFVGVESDPVTCSARFDHTGRPVSVRATYADGWSCTMRLHKDGSYSLSYSVSLTVRSKAKP